MSLSKGYIHLCFVQIYKLNYSEDKFKLDHIEFLKHNGYNNQWKLENFHESNGLSATLIYNSRVC